MATEGRLSSGVDLQREMGNNMSGVPAEVVSAFSSATASALTQWAGTVKVPALPWYPPFSVSPVSPAGPLANVPIVLVNLAQSSNAMEPNNLAQAIRSRLGNLAGLSGSDAAVQAYTAAVGACFGTWVSRQMVINVMGEGPVILTPSPAEPLPGPVVNGQGKQNSPMMSVSPSDCP